MIASDIQWQGQLLCDRIGFFHAAFSHVCSTQFCERLALYGAKMLTSKYRAHKSFAIRNKYNSHYGASSERNENAVAAAIHQQEFAHPLT